MVRERLWGGGSQRLALLFLTVVVPPITTLVWLGAQLVEQDRALWKQREDERRQTLARAAVLSLEQSLTDAERRSEGPLPEGVVRLRVTPRVVKAEPLKAVLWLPVTTDLEAADGQPFVEAETLEYRGHTAAARQTYAALAHSPQRAARAGALLRLARIARRENRSNDALHLYDELSRLTQVAFDGMPSDLLARRAACSVREAAGDRAALSREAASLESDLLEGRWMLDRTRWELVVGDITRWTGRPLSTSPEREAFSRAAQWLWTQRRQGAAGAADQQFRRCVIGDGVSITILERSVAGDTEAIAIAPGVLREWASRAGAGVALWTASGQNIAGAQPAVGDANGIRISSTVSGLPWTVTFTAAPAARPPAARQRLLFVGLGAMSLFAAGGTFLLWRVVQRELAVARLQTDFVAAVSHEFRTPLAALRHVTELLEEGDEMARQRRLTFYQSLSRNTERLHRLVESLLDFARMERGRKPYDMQPLDAAAFARDVVEDFRKEAEPRGYRVEVEIEADVALGVHADASSMVRALWNLLDNAVKYSPEPRPIRVRVGRHPQGVALAVKDHGIGVPAKERKDIFRKFVRGQSAGRLGIKGTGLGLAMVSHIVDAHGGRVEVESEEGAGSTFRIILPAPG